MNAKFWRGIYRVRSQNSSYILFVFNVYLCDPTWKVSTYGGVVAAAIRGNTVR